MSQARIVPGSVPAPSAPGVRSGRPPAQKYFTFSLRYWQEHAKFGIGDVSTAWFSSLLTRLQELCREKIARFIDETDFQDAIRYHPVNWDARNIPITLASLSWLPREIRENPVEFPLVQFHVSKATGRVHGFWDADWCFQVVLLDPMHNLQPSKDVGYKVRPTSLAGCQYSALRVALDRACANQCPDKSCELARGVRAAVPAVVDGQVMIIAGVTQDVAEKLLALRESQQISVSDIVEYGVTFWEDGTAGIDRQ